MKSPDADFINKIAQSQLRTAELYEIELNTGTKYYYTTHSEDIAWDSPPVTYQSVQPIQRSPISFNLTGDADVVTVSISGISGELADAAQKNLIDAATLTIKRILWDESYAAGMEITQFVGRVNISYNRQVLTLSCKTLLDGLNLKIPTNIYQEPCNRRLFDTICGLTKSSFKLSKAVTAASGNNFDVKCNDSTLVGNINSDATYYYLGEIKMTSGQNIGQRRMIRTASVSGGVATITVAVAFPYEGAISDDFDIYLGCDHTPETCNGRFGNRPNWFGFQYILKPEEVLF